MSNFKIKIFLFSVICTLAFERILLVKNGGQFFIIDELRYNSGHHILSFIKNLDLYSLLVYLENNSAHIFFTLFCSICEFIRYISVYFWLSPGLPAYELNNSYIGIKVSAFILSLFSIVNILILLCIIKKITKNIKDIYTVFILFALSTTNLYFSRHLVPYDISITFALLSFYFLNAEKYSSKTIFLCGLFSSISTLLYFGYWYLSATTWICFLLKGYKNKSIVRYTSICGIAGLFPIIFLYVLELAYNIPLMNSIMSFFVATKNFQMGDLSNGFFTFFEYFWYSENVLFILIFSCYIYSIFKIVKKRNFNLEKENIVIVYTTILLLFLFIFSQLLDLMVIYGRTVKPLVPFLCLIASSPLLQLLNLFKRKLLVYKIIISMFAICTYNHYKVLKLSFLKEFEKDVNTMGVKNFERISSINNSNSKPSNNNSNSDFIVVNTEWIIPPFNNPVLLPIPEGKILLNKDSPYNYKPYQFLGLNRKERNVINSIKPRMLLIDQKR